MANRLSYLQLVFLLASFVARAKGQEDGAFISIDQFQFPRLLANGSIPLYYDRDTLLVRYISRISGPSMNIALKCVARTETQVANDLFPDVDGDALTVASKDNLPSYSGTVPFQLPSLPQMQVGIGGPSCAFILSGYHDDPKNGNVVNLQSDKFQISFTRARGHYVKTYGIEGEVPNGDYPIITGTGTYGSLPTATTRATTSLSISTSTTTTSAMTTKAISTSNEAGSTTSSSLTTTSSVSTTASSMLPDFSSSATVVSSALIVISLASTAITLSTTTSSSASTADASATSEGSSQPTGTTGETRKGGELSSAASAGIGAGVAVGAIALLGLAFFLWRRRRQNGKGSLGSSSTPEVDRREGVAELHGKHMSELSGTDYVRRPPHHQGLGVQRAEVGGGQQQRVELP